MAQGQALPVTQIAYHIGAACDMPEAHWAVAPGPDGWGAVIRWQQSDATIAPPEIEIDADPETLYLIGDALRAIAEQEQARMQQLQQKPNAGT